MIFLQCSRLKSCVRYVSIFSLYKSKKIAISQPPVIDGERSVFCGWKKGQFTWQNLIINYELFLEYREKFSL